MSAVPLSTRVVEYVPDSLSEEENPPTFRLKPASVADRQQFRADLVGRLGAYPVDGDLFDLALRGLEAAGRPDWTGGDDWTVEDREALANLVEVVREQSRAMAEWVMRSAVVGEPDGPAPEAEPGLWDRWIQLDGHLREHFPPLAQAYARRVRWSQEQPRAAFARFVRGWRNVEVDGMPFACRRGMSDVEPVCLEALEFALPGVVSEVGRHVVSLLYADTPLRKKSGSPSGSSASPTPSTVGPTTGDSASTAAPGESASDPAPTSTRSILH